MSHSRFTSSDERKHRNSCAQLALCLGVIALWGIATKSSAADVLIVDRLSSSVYRYSAAGSLLGTVVPSTVDILMPTGIGMSPDFRQLYVSSSQRNRVMRYDYNPATGVATNPTLFADPDDGLAFPNDIQFSPDGSVVYVSNLNGGVSRFHTDGSSAGPKLMLPTDDEETPTPASSLSFMSTGELLVGAFQDSTGAKGGIAISDAAVSAISQNLVEPRTEVRGATGLMVHEGFLYVSGLFSGQIRRFALADGPSLAKGQMDPAWGITGLSYPQDLAAAPDGNGFIVGILGQFGGGGFIARYAYDGTSPSTFAVRGSGGFTEATAFVVVPTPPAGITGDFNNDGKVDSADYLVWRKSSPTATLPNDDTPGVVDTSDYNDWRANFGKTSPGSGAGLGSAAVPEPTLFLLAIIGVMVGGLVRVRN